MYTNIDILFMYKLFWNGSSLADFNAEHVWLSMFEGTPGVSRNGSSGRHSWGVSTDRNETNRIHAKQGSARLCPPVMLVGL